MKFNEQLSNISQNTNEDKIKNNEEEIKTNKEEEFGPIQPIKKVTENKEKLEKEIAKIRESMGL